MCRNKPDQPLLTAAFAFIAVALSRLSTGGKPLLGYGAFRKAVNGEKHRPIILPVAMLLASLPGTSAKAQFLSIESFIGYNPGV